MDAGVRISAAQDKQCYYPLAFLTKANAADNPSYNEAMNGPDRDGFIEANMKLEIDQLERHGRLGSSRSTAQ